MIVLDTNILSGIVSDRPNPVIVDWLNWQPREEIFTTTLTFYESWMGIEKLDPSRRRTALEEAFAFTMEKLLNGRILPFDTHSARAAAILAANRRRAGRPVETRDTLIAGIVLVHNATLATENTRHFLDANISLVNPLERA